MKTLALVLVVMLCTTVAHAEVPQTMSYQGVLRDATGNVVPDGDYDLTFSLYNVWTGGTAFWTETQTLPVEGGIFNAILGSNVPITLGFQTQYWLGISIEGEPELSPRVQLTSVPYAVHASYSDDSGDDGDWSVNGSDLYRYVGNIGIGTVVPSQRLEIQEDTDAFVGIRIKNDDTGSLSQEGVLFSNENGDLAGMRLYDDDSSYSDAMSIYNNRPQGNIRLSTGSVERVRIDNMGYVGIGVTGPSRLLDVGGGVKMLAYEMPTGAADGYVLTSDAVGNGTWQSAPGGGGLTLPYAGSAAADDPAPVFQVTNTSTGPAVRGVCSWPYNSTAGYLADSFYGVLGEDLDTGNFGYLGHNSYGVHGKVYTDGKAIYGRHDPTMNYGYIGSETHAGYFSGNVTITDSLGIGTDTPTKALYVAGEVFVTSYRDDRVLDVLNNYTGQLSQMVNIERGGVPDLLNDILSVNSVATSPDDFQFIECERGGVIEFAVDGSGLVYANGGADINGGTSIAGGLYVDSSGLRGGEFLSDELSDDTHVVHSEFTGVGSYDAVAVYGKSTPVDNYGYGGMFEGGYYGVQALANGAGGSFYTGVYGQATTTGTGTSYGVHGHAYSAGGTARGVYGGVGGSGTLHAGYFAGDVHVTGTISQAGGSFKIDHPLDPENKYLYHSFVESPDMMNVYNGNVVLDAGGAALVELPDWFEALNSDFRYQLTAIGAPGPNLYVAEEIVGNTFRIAGGQPGAKVSWQVTGVRQDAFARANRIPVEEDKPAAELGKYLHADAFGKPATLSVDYEEAPRALPESGKLGAPDEHRERAGEGDGE